MKINDIKISRKITYAFGCVILCFVAVSLFVWMNLGLIKQASDWDSHTSEVIANIDAAGKAMVDRETGVRGYLLSGDKNFLEPFLAGNAAFDSAVGNLARLTADNPTQQDRIHKLKSIEQEWLNQVAKREIDLRGAPATAQQGIEIETGGGGKSRMDAIRVILHDMRQMESDLSVKRAEATASTMSGTKTALAVGALIAIFMVIAMITVVNATVVSPLVGVTRAMTDITSGKRNVEVPAQGRKDEVGELAAAAFVFGEATEKLRKEAEASVSRESLEEERIQREAAQTRAAAEQRQVVAAISAAVGRLAVGDLTCTIDTPLPGDAEKMRIEFNTALEQLREALLAVTQSATSIHGSSVEVSDAANNLAKRTEQQAASLEEAAASLDEITATVRQTAENANEASKVVDSAKADAEHSGEVMREAVEAMGQIEGSANQISQIIGVIDEIAFQTNLLALNAGVEAARAGEAGRGFAVVATEVRALAQRSADAAREIKTLISTSSNNVKAGVDLVAKTGQALEMMIAKFGGISSLASNIASSAREQATGLVEVNTAINHMDQMTQQNAAMVEETTAASKSLSSETENLKARTAHFRTGHDMAGHHPAPRAMEAPARRPQAMPQMRTVGSGGAARKAHKEEARDESWSEF